MNRTPRTLKFATYLSIIKQKPYALYMGTVFVIVPIFMSLMFMAIPDFEQPEQVNKEALLEDGQIASGILISKDTVFNVTDNGRNPVDVTYSFNQDSRIRIDTMRTLSLYQLRKMNVNDTIEVAYKNKDSVITNLEPYSFPIPTAVFGLFPLFFLLFGLPFLIPVIIRSKRLIQLYKHGIPSKGRIVTMESESSMMFMFNSKSRFKIHYEYEGQGGNEIFGSSLTSDLSIVNQNKQGDEISIFVSPTNESKSCLIDQIEARRNNWNLN